MKPMVTAITKITSPTKAKISPTTICSSFPRGRWSTRTCSTAKNTVIISRDLATSQAERPSSGQKMGRRAADRVE